MPGLLLWNQNFRRLKKKARRTLNLSPRAGAVTFCFLLLVCAVVKSLVCVAVLIEDMCAIREKAGILAHENAARC